MYVNNEIGTIQPIKEIGRALQKYKEEHKEKRERTTEKNIYPLFHSDACQAPNYLPIRPDSLRLDLMTLNSSKVYGPKGVGCLYIKEGSSISPTVLGGGQEYGMRSGTEPVSLVYGFSHALEKTLSMCEEETKRVTALRDLFFKELPTYVPEAFINGSIKERVANNINISIPGFLSEELIIRLDAVGFAISAKSACAGSNDEGLKKMSKQQKKVFVLL
jgi:cysteine desulfurase